MNNITFVREEVNIETIKNGKIVKLPQVPKPGPNLREQFKKIWYKNNFRFGM